LQFFGRRGDFAASTGGARRGEATAKHHGGNAKTAHLAAIIAATDEV
jgi:hypothetical protein